MHKLVHKFAFKMTVETVNIKEADTYPPTRFVKHHKNLIKQS